MRACQRSQRPDYSLSGHAAILKRIGYRSTPANQQFDSRIYYGPRLRTFIENEKKIRIYAYTYSISVFCLLWAKCNKTPRSRDKVSTLFTNQSIGFKPNKARSYLVYIISRWIQKKSIKRKVRCAKCFIYIECRQIAVL